MVFFTTSLSCTANSSTPGTSNIANLNWIGGKPTTVVVAATNANSSIFYNVQYTLDDVQRVASSLVYWQNLSSAYSDTGVSQSSGSTFASSNLDPNAGLIVSFLSPVGAIRLNSTALTAGPLTLKVMQGEGW
jgi:hypothetical protein